jgi:hypothetical protein
MRFVDLFVEKMQHPARLLFRYVLFVLIVVFCSATHTFAQAQRESIAVDKCLQSLVRSYPEVLASVTRDSLYWRNGVVMPLGTMTIPQQKHLLTTSEWEAILDGASLRDQFAECYPVSDSIKAPSRNSDPGRVRYEPFFRQMYGATEEAVRQKLVPVRWLAHLPEAAKTLMVTSVNDVNERLQAVSDELEQLPPEYRQYLVKPGGTFKWRTIAGTARQSNHSFAAAIDINVPLSNYWRNDMTKEDRFSYKNRIPLQIVRIFEKHGFIWGGRWYHYDTMHFEYRPELLTSECGCGGKP